MFNSFTVLQRGPHVWKMSLGNYFLKPLWHQSFRLTCIRYFDCNYDTTGLEELNSHTISSTYVTVHGNFSWYTEVIIEMLCYVKSMCITTWGRIWRKLVINLCWKLHLRQIGCLLTCVGNSLAHYYAIRRIQKVRLIPLRALSSLHKAKVRSVGFFL